LAARCLRQLVGTLRLRLRLSALPLRGLVSLLPFRPRPDALDEPPQVAVAFDAQSGAPRRLPESEPEGRSVLKGAKRRADKLPQAACCQAAAGSVL
jgi:hypothetical protein